METGEQQKPREETTSISTKTANMLGKGLQQMFAEPTQKLEDALNSRVLGKIEPKYQKWVQEWKPTLDSISEMFNSLVTARCEVSVRTVVGGGDFEFKTPNILSRFFSALHTRNPHAITISPELTAEIVKILHDRINNKIGAIMGQAELISEHVSDEELKTQTRQISKLGMQFSNTLNNKFGHAQEIKLIKDSQGNVQIETITPSPSSSPSQKT